MKFIGIVFIATIIAGCSTHVSSGVNYEFSVGSGTVHPTVRTFND